MFIRLLLLLTVVPLVELWLLFEISDRATIPFTIALVLVTGFVGAVMARRQGWQTWRRIQEQMARGQPPTDSLMDGFLILIAAAVLITPGILTDILGFALLVPALRNVVKAWMARKFKAHVVTTFQTGQTVQSHSTTGEGQSVIDAEFKRHPPDDVEDQ